MKQPTALIRWLDGTQSEAALASSAFAWIDYGDGLGFGWLLRFSESPLIYRELECGRLTPARADHPKGEGGEDGRDVPVLRGADRG